MNLILQSISFVCSERVQWSVCTSASSFLFAYFLLSFIGYVLKGSVFIKAVVGFCLRTMQILFKNFKKYVALNQIVDLKKNSHPRNLGLLG